MSKAHAHVTLPCLLLLLDYWPLRRFPFSPMDSGMTAGSRPAGVLRLVLEKIPFFLLSAASLRADFREQKECGAMVPLGTTPLETRLANACVAYGTYLAKTFWPVKLAVFYPLTRWDFSAPEALGALLVILAATGGAMLRGKNAALPHHRLALVSGHAGSRHRRRPGGPPIHGGPLYVSATDRLVSDGGVRSRRRSAPFSNSARGGGSGTGRAGSRRAGRGDVAAGVVLEEQYHAFSSTPWR